jgi:hypothetical protein
VKKLESHHFHVELSTVQKLTIGAAVVLIALIALITAYSDQVRLHILGLFCQVLGAIILGLGLIKTNDELVDIVSHHEKFDKHRLVKHLTKDRFFLVFGLFLLVLGILLQIISVQLLG